jgi:DNA polymerase/3'-5' exonuclease PolX
MEESNKNIISKFEELLILYKKDPSLKFKCKALSTAIPALKQYHQPIQCGKQAMNDIKGIGKGIADRIDEIINSGSLVELGVKNEKYESIDVIKSITGVGDVRAEKWYNLGLRSVEDVKRAILEKKITSTHHIDLGLKYYEDMKERILRDEIEKIEKKIKKSLKKVDKDLIFEICGSYRRGQSTSGDIDLLVSNPKYPEHISNEKYLQKIVKQMSEDELLIDHLTEDGDTKYMGFCKLNSKTKARRIDIRVIDYISYYAGVLYFTGSQHFNIEVRNKALEKGMSLNEYGLSKLDNKEKIFLKSEEDIFKILDIPYRTPCERNI